MAKLLVTFLIGVTVFGGCSACDLTAIAPCAVQLDTDYLPVYNAIQADAAVKAAECPKLPGYLEDFETCTDTALEGCDMDAADVKEQAANVQTAKDNFNTNAAICDGFTGETSCVATAAAATAAVAECAQKLDVDYLAVSNAIEADSSVKETECKKLPGYLTTFNTCSDEATEALDGDDDCSSSEVTTIEDSIQETEVNFNTNTNNLGCKEYIEDNGAGHNTVAMVTMLFALLLLVL